MLSTVLVIDDDPDDLDFIREAWQDISPATECHTANSAVEAMALLEKESFQLPDLILLDINMPLMNGWECLTFLKNHSRYKDIAIVMFSTTSSLFESEKAIASGALCCCEKPTSFEKLKNFVSIINTSEGSSQEIVTALKKAVQEKQVKIYGLA